MDFILLKYLIKEETNEVINKIKIILNLQTKIQYAKNNCKKIIDLKINKIKS